MSHMLSGVEGRREMLLLALAAAEVSWLAPAFMAVVGAKLPHPPLLLWLALLALLLGFFYFYRALTKANLPLWLQQGLLAAIYVLCVGLAFRFHVYAVSGAGAGWVGFDWVVQPFRRLSDTSGSAYSAVVTIFFLLFIWMRSIQLARRSLSVRAVGLGFRWGVIILMWGALGVRLFTSGDVSAFVAPYFVFGLIAVALARVEEVGRASESRQTQGSRFWIGSAVAAVGVVVLLSSLVAVFFTGGGLMAVVQFLSPLLVVLRAILIGFTLLMVALLELVLPLFRGQLAFLRQWLSEMLELVRLRTTVPEATTMEEVDVTQALGTFQVSSIVIIVAVVVGLVLFTTWWRMRRDRQQAAYESRESLLSAAAVGRNLLDALRAGRDRLAQMASVVDRFGLGSRLLSAISIQRIYANLVRLATREGYPRVKAQTPYEYLAVLGHAWPESQEDMALITEAYVNAHYGQVPDSKEELEQIRVSWKRVRARIAKA